MKLIGRHVKDHFYGIMTVCSYLLSIFVLHYFKDIEPFNKITNPHRIITNIMYIYIFFARLFFCLFDNPKPLTLSSFVKVWKGGLSSFGGQFAVLSYMIYLSYSQNIKVHYLFDICILLVPIPGVLIRIGNYVNNEIGSRYNNLLHISLIEMLLHGVLFGMIVYYNFIFYYEPGMLLNIYTRYYATIRFFTEFLREPKKYYNIKYNQLTIGIWQVCCLITINPYFLLFVIDQYSKSSKKYNINHNWYQSNFQKSLNLSFCVFLMLLITLLNSYLFKISIIYLIGMYSIIIDTHIFSSTRNNIEYNKKTYNLNNIYVIIGLCLKIFGINCNYTFYYNY